MTGTSGQHGTERSEPALLAVYLNDHYAGSTAGLALFRRTARAHRGSERGETLAQLVREIAEDRRALRQLMRDLTVPVQRYKVVAGWLGEKLGRAKPNGYAVRRSPVSSVMELEALTLGVLGKGSGWRTLRLVADDDERLDAARLDALIARAERQAATLETLRVQAVTEALVPQ